MSNLTKKNIVKFKKEGYLVLDNIISKKDIATFEITLNSIFKSKLNYLNINKSINIRNLNSKELINKFPKILAKNTREELDFLVETISQSLTFVRMTNNYKIQKIVNTLFNKESNNPLYGYINRFRINLPKDNIAELDWHREIFQTIPRANFIQIWAPLINDSSITNGALQIIPRSHNANLSLPKWETNKNGVSKVFYDKESIANKKILHMNLKLGQVLFFSGKTLHRSGNNQSKFSRFSMVGLYHDIDDPYFIPPNAHYTYRKETPKQYYQSLLNDS